MDNEPGMVGTIGDRVLRLEKRQEALYQALKFVIKDGIKTTCPIIIWDRLESAFEDKSPEPEEEPGEDQEWKTCECCDGTGIVEEGVVGNMFHYEECESCDGKGKYIDDMD